MLLLHSNDVNPDVQQVCDQQNWGAMDASDTECLKQLEGVKNQARCTMKAGSSMCEELEYLHAQLIACSGTLQGMEFHNKVTMQQIRKREVCFPILAVELAEVNEFAITKCRALCEAVLESLF